MNFKKYMTISPALFHPGILIALVVLTGLVLSIPRSPAHDEVFYLTEAMNMADSLSAGHWFGNQPVGFHGFLFKIPAALILMITGPSVFAATITTIIFAALAVYLCYLVFLHFLESRAWAAGGSLLLFTAVFFLRALASFKRDIPAVLALLLFIFCIVKKKNKWLTALSLLLLLDAKESVFFTIIPALFAWMLFVHIKRFKQMTGYSTVIFMPSIFFIILMLTGSIIPLNPSLTKVIGLNKGGFSYFVRETFSPQKTTRNSQEGGREIVPLYSAEDLGWFANYNGLAVLAGDVDERTGLPVVKLIKPTKKSYHTTGGSSHRWSDPAYLTQCVKGDTLIFSFSYKVGTKQNRQPRIVLRYTDESSLGEVIKHKMPIIPDFKWHDVNIEIPITREGLIQPEIEWPYGRDMILFVSGCRVEQIHAPRETQPVTPQAGVMDALPWKWLDLSFAYIGKLFYSRTFSITSMPRFIIIPAFLMSFVLFRRWKNEGEYARLILPLIFWVYMIVYILHSSYGRYLLPVVPVIILCFAYFLRDGLKMKRFAGYTLIATSLFAVVGLWFETNYPVIKISITVFFMAGLWFLYMYRHRRTGSHEAAGLFKGVFVVLLALVSGAIFIGTSFANSRQLGRFAAFGCCGQMKEIASQFKPGETIWINYDVGLIQFFRHDKAYRPFKSGFWNWELQEKVPKASLLELPQKYDTYSFLILNNNDFHKNINQYRIRTVALVVSTLKEESYRFPKQKWLTRMMKMSFLKLKRKISLKNKELYVFSVTSEHNEN